MDDDTVQDVANVDVDVMHKEPEPVRLTMQLIRKCMQAGAGNAVNAEQDEYETILLL